MDCNSTLSGLDPTNWSSSIFIFHAHLANQKSSLVETSVSCIIRSKHLFCFRISNLDSEFRLTKTLNNSSINYLPKHLSPFSFLSRLSDKTIFLVYYMQRPRKLKVHLIFWDLCMLGEKCTNSEFSTKHTDSNEF